MKTYYEILGISQNASAEEIRAAYLDKRKQYNREKITNIQLSEMTAVEFREKFQTAQKKSYKGYVLLVDDQGKQDITFC